MKFNFFFSFMSHALWSYLRNLCLPQWHKDFLFSSGSFIVLSFSFRSMIHFKKIFVYNAKYGLSRAIKDIRFNPTCKLTSCPAAISTDADKRPRTPETETKNFIIAQQAVWASCLYWFPMSSESHRGYAKRPRWIKYKQVHREGLYHSSAIPSLGNINPI